MNTALKVLLGAAVVGGGAYAVTKAVKKKPKKKNGKKKPKKTTDPSAVEHVFVQAASLDPVVFEDFHPELQAAVNPADIVVSMTPDGQLYAYEYMLHLIGNKGMDVLGKVPDREEAVKLTLNSLVPNADFTRGLEPYVYESPHYWIWQGVSNLGELAHMNLEAKGVVGSSSALAPGSLAGMR